MNAVLVGRELAPEAERDARVTRWALETFESRLGLVIRRLADCPYLAGERFTAADISVSYALLLGLRTGNYVPGLSSGTISLARRHAPPTPEQWKAVRPPRLGRRDHRDCGARFIEAAKRLVEQSRKVPHGGLPIRGPPRMVQLASIRPWLHAYESTCLIFGLQVTIAEEIEARLKEMIVVAGHFLARGDVAQGVGFLG